MDKNTKIRAIIWDMGGVLLRTENMQPRFDLAAEFGVSYAFLNDLIFSSHSSLQSETGVLTSQTHWQNIARELGLPDGKAGELAQRWFAGDQIDSTLIAYIRSLRRGYKTALLSNAWEGTREIVDGLYGFLDAFDQVLFSYEVGFRKPDPQIFSIILSRLEVEPEEVIFIDDFENNIRAAQKVGIKTIQFFNTNQVLMELNRIGI